MHVLGAHQPVGRARHSFGYLLVRALAVSLLGDAIEEFGELNEALATPEEPLPLLKTGLFHLPD